MPIYLFLTIFSPKNAIVFFILFIFFDIVPRAEYYGVGSIHTIVIGDVVWPIHYSLIFILIIGYCFRRVYLNENLFKTDKLGILILFFMATFAVKYAISMSNPLGLVQIKVVEIGLLSAMYFVYTGELKNPQNIYYVLKWMWFGMIAMLIYGYYQLIFGNYTDYNIPFQMSYILHENTITGGYFALFTFIVYHLEKRKKVDVIKVFIVLFLYLLILPFTLKRGAMLGGGIGLLSTFIIYYRKKIGKYTILLFGVIVIVFFAVQWILSTSIISEKNAQMMINRLEAISVSNVDASGAMRVVQWLSAIEILKKHPFIGLPHNQHFSSQLGPFVYEHTLDNNYLFIAIIGGSFALLAFFVLLITFLKIAFRVLKTCSTDPMLNPLIVGSIGSVIALIVSDIFEVHVILPRVAPFHILSFAIVSICSRIQNINNSI